MLLRMCLVCWNGVCVQRQNGAVKGGGCTLTHWIDSHCAHHHYLSYHYHCCYQQQYCLVNVHFMCVNKWYCQENIQIFLYKVTSKQTNRYTNHNQTSILVFSVPMMHHKAIGADKQIASLAEVFCWMHLILAIARYGSGRNILSSSVLQSTGVAKGIRSRWNGCSKKVYQAVNSLIPTWTSSYFRRWR